MNIESLVRPNILQLKPYSSARDEFSGKEGTFLDANENPFGILNRYPDPLQIALKKKLSNLKKVKLENIFIGNGSDELIDLALRIFCKPGIDKAITFFPSYGMYDVSSAINNVELIKIPLSEDFQIDIEKLNPHFNDANIKLLFLCSPNNPTGNLMNTEDIKFILENFYGVVIVDEAYVDFAESASLISLTRQYPNLIISQTFSKAWGLAAARVGSAYANEKIISLFNKVKPPYNVSEINQQAAIDALEDYDTFENNLAKIKSEKARLQKELSTIDLVKNIYPSDANFFLIKVDDADRIYGELIDKKIITRNRTTQIKNCLRITIGRQNENNELLAALKTLS